MRITYIKFISQFIIWLWIYYSILSYIL